NQHEQAAQLGEQKEFYAGIFFSVIAPYSQKEEHGNEHDLPKEIEEDEIHGKENAEDTSQEPKYIKMIKSDAFVDFFPGYDYTQGAHKERERCHNQTEPVQ